MLRQELQSYLDSIYTDFKIDMECSHSEKVHIRFEFGGDKKLGTIKRVNQSSERALTIFNETFINLTNEIFVLIYEYQRDNVFNSSNDYLHK